MFLHPQSFHIGKINVTLAEQNDSKKYYLQTIGLPKEEKPMMKEIKTTPVKAAWLCKKNSSTTKNVDDTKFSDECSDVMHILSLIPPEILNKRGNTDDSDNSLEEIEEDILNELQNIESKDQARTAQDDNHEEMEIDGTPEIDTAENELDESMHNSNEDVTQENDTHENDNIQHQGDQNNILEQITSNLLSGQ